MKKSVKVAVVQATPVLFDLDRSIEKVCALLAECSRKHPDLILFPESFIPCYPRGLTFGAEVGRRSDEGKNLWQRYWQNSLETTGTAISRISEAARKARAITVLGVTEKDSTSGTLYCTMLYFSATGELVAKHRKLKPTGTERLIWGEGDGSTLSTLRTDSGIIGGLICWENYMPLARMAMYRKGVEIYLAPTADARPQWQSTLQHIALEGRCFVLGCNQFVRKDDYPADLLPLLDESADVMCRGGSVIVSPAGEILAGPLWDQEGILFANLNEEEIIKAKMDFDVIGHYARNDVFKFEIPDQPETIDIHSKE
ncbi:MAG: carbon-nitrogen hydrolase family protein [Clostridia bacterium]|nr:carbon-nitrogen hydrolase family protein [Clostridia bacterium]